MKSREFTRAFRFTFLFIIGFTPVVFSQEHTVTGTISSNKSPLEYVTIVMYKVSDTSRIVSGRVTDSLGRFSFTDIALGSYVLKANIQGYLPQQQSFSIDPQHQNLTLPEIELLPDIRFLNRVVVTSQRNLLKKTASGFIMSAGSNITQATGTATDLLRNTPAVMVDEEGAITIRGKAPLILINGRNSNLSATDRIPASSVETIEVINNPSAKYDADAESGIINIVLKKNLASGTNGSIALGAGYGVKGRISSAIIVNHNKGKWNTGFAYDSRFAKRTRKAEAGRINFQLPDDYHLLQNRHDDRFEKTQNMKLNVDFTPNKNNVLSFEVIGNLSGEDNHETLESLLEKQNGTFNYKNSRQSEEFERGKALEGAFNFNKKFEDKRKSLSLALTSSLDFDRENTGITTQSQDISGNKTGNPFLQRTHNRENSSISNLRLDFSRPVGEKGIMETGYKDITRVAKANFQSLYALNNEYVPNPQASNLFNFWEQVHAAYITYKNSIGSGDAVKLKYDFGIRGEQVWNKGYTASKDVAFKTSYFNLFPSLTMAYYLKESDFFKLAYNRRINRPGLGQLNPFIDITDSLNPHGGNPYLKPELVNSVELGYNKEGSSLSLVSNLFFRYSTNIIQPFISLDSSGVALVAPKNYGNSTIYGFEEILSAFPVKFYNCNASVSLFQQNINGANVSSDALRNYFSWYAKIINNFVLWKESKLQLIANYNSPIATPQGTRIAVYNIDGGFQQKMFKGKAAFGLVVTDIFNTQRSGITALNKNFSYYRHFKVDSRAMLLTFTYSFKTLAKEELLENKFQNN